MRRSLGWLSVPATLLIERWRRSLKLRTMTITGLITAVMIVISGTFILASVSDDLFTQRRLEALQDSARATVQAQLTINSSDSSDPRVLRNVVTSMLRTVSNMSSSDYLVFRRQADQPRYVDAPQFSLLGPEFADLITPELSEALRLGEDVQYWQSIELGGDNESSVPGIAVGSVLTLPGASGKYDLILGYNLEDTANIYQLITRILLITALFLMLLIGGLVFGITRIVFRPIRVAADTSRRLAAGEAEARMPLQGDEHFDVLSENFNVMADTLQARIAELDELSEMQQRFVSDVSHELRTPLTTLKLATEVLTSQTDELGPGQTRAVQVMNEQVARFERLLEDLLEISRYDAGQVSISTEPSNIVHLVEEAVQQLQPLSPSEINVRSLGGFTAIDIDPRRIRRIITNLIGNAIEHGEGRPIDVTVDSNATATAVSVRDRGVGMSEEATARVFERFWRADPSRKRTLGGTGLGLAIAREDATVHGGVLEVWSRPGRGTNFRLTLPRDEREAAFISPLTLIPEDELGANELDDTTGGWLRRPLRRLRKRGAL